MQNLQPVIIITIIVIVGLSFHGVFALLELSQMTQQNKR